MTDDPKRIVADGYNVIAPRYLAWSDLDPSTQRMRYLGRLLELLAPADEVLELGCGTGRVLIPTARAGIEIVGLDASPQMLAVCRSRLQQEPPDVQARVRLLEGDMRRFTVDRTFRLATIPYRPFQHLLTVSDQFACLRSIHQHLADEALAPFVQPGDESRPLAVLLVEGQPVQGHPVGPCAVELLQGDLPLRAVDDGVGDTGLAAAAAAQAMDKSRAKAAA